MALSLAYPFRDYLHQREELAAATAEQHELEMTVAALKEQQAALSDPDYIKAEAKKRLQYVTPGDTVYVVQAPAVPEAGATGTVPAEAEQKPWYSTLWGTLSDPNGTTPDGTPPDGTAPDGGTTAEPAIDPAATPTAPAGEYDRAPATESMPATPTSGTGG